MKSQDFDFNIIVLIKSVYKEDIIYRDFNRSMLKESKQYK